LTRVSVNPPEMGLQGGPCAFEHFSRVNSRSHKMLDVDGMSVRHYIFFSDALFT